MNIGANTVVSLDVELSDLWGNLIEKSASPLQYLHGGHGDIFPVVEAMLEGKTAGERVDVRLEPEEAFGDYDESLLRVRERSSLPEPLEIGMRFEGDPGTEDEGLIFTVTDIAEDKAVLDANHPLAGMGLRLVATVVEVRHATADEIEHRAADDADSSVLLRVVP